MRGKGRFLCTEHPPNRITPAYAGKSGINCNQIPVTGDHPRLCGEKSPHRARKTVFLGSPPPMRGKIRSLSISYVENRITPAYAGKRYLSRIGDALMGDHPRLCGEKQLKAFGIRCNRRITPAYAGKRKVCTDRTRSMRDHPRLCGEKPLSTSASCSAMRITPAYAGKSPIFPPSFHNIWDHPRLCGEKANKTIKTANAEGSPPPMRGKAKAVMSVDGAVRITPAYAGKRVKLHARK